MLEQEYEMEKLHLLTKVEQSFRQIEHWEWMWTQIQKIKNLIANAKTKPQKGIAQNWPYMKTGQQKEHFMVGKWLKISI